MTKSIRLEVPESLWNESKTNFSYYNIGKDEFMKLVLEMFLEKNLGFHESLLSKLVETGRFSEKEAQKRINLLRQLEVNNDTYCNGVILEM